MFSWLRKTFWQIVAWFRGETHATPPPQAEPLPPVQAPDLSRKTDADIYAAGLVPPPVVPPAPAVQPTIAAPRFHRPAKWVKPKGLEKLPPPKPREAQEAKPRRVSTPKPKAHVSDDDPEQWGQYYFRDAILDQLERYFIYLKRMKKRDPEAYNLHRQLGIQILPSGAVKSFDNWREKETTDQLSAWWKETRPAFGAVSYGIDDAGTEEETYGVADLSPEQWEEAKKNGYNPDRAGKSLNDLPKHRIVTFCGGSHPIKLGDREIKTAKIWVPKFLYFHKYKKPPPEIQHVVDGDVYTMTIYWDRISGYSNTFHKRHKGGSPQEYAVCVEKETGEVRVLRQLMHDKIKIRSKKEGRSFSIPHKHWGYPEEHLNWARRENMSPEDFLRRCFMETALMYETASMGSMIRISASKGNLVATFGVEIKRTSYFFKDRDIVLNDKGKIKRIFHIVRPHLRKSGVAVQLHFRGLREFEWAGYKISITVPGLDHANLTELNIGSDSLAKGERMPKGSIGSRATGAYLARWIKEGKRGMEVSQRNKELMRRINECGDDLGDVITWPDSASTNTTVENQIKALKKLFKENGYPYGMIYLSMMHMASVAYSATNNREGVKHEGLKKAWIKLADLLP